MIHRSLYQHDEPALAGSPDDRWLGDLRAVAWDSAAVGPGDHEMDSWQAFAATVVRDTLPRVVSSDHDDPLHVAESGVVTSAALLDSAGVESDTR